jgi:uncharacterized membrane protein YcaP (DUF421 family)
MDVVLRAAIIYFFLMLVFRISGKRSLQQITTFDFVLLLILSETTQQALVGQDYSIVNALLAITTLVGLDIGISLWKQKSPGLEKLVDGTPLVLIEDGKLLKDRMDKERVDEEDILEAARALQGLERMEQIKYAVLERNGSITIVPQPEAK